MRKSSRCWGGTFLWRVRLKSAPRPCSRPSTSATSAPSSASNTSFTSTSMNTFCQGEVIGGGHSMYSLLMINLHRSANSTTLQDLLSSVELAATDDDKAKTVGSFVFRNAFFYLLWDNDDDDNADDDYNEYELATQLKTRRLEQLNGFGRRSKVIVRPEAVLLLGNHDVWTHAKGGHHSIMHTLGGWWDKPPSHVDKSAPFLCPRIQGIVEHMFSLVLFLCRRQKKEYLWD